MIKTFTEKLSEENKKHLHEVVVPDLKGQFGAEVVADNEYGIVVLYRDYKAIERSYVLFAQDTDGSLFANVEHHVIQDFIVETT